MGKPLKPWLSFADQLQQLQVRGLQVDNSTAALDYLERLGYYRLSGYWYPLRAVDLVASAAQGKAVRQDTFVPNSRFEDVVRLYVFDKKLRLLALDALERIEMAVRVDVAHLLGQRDPRAHENPACLHGNFSKKPLTKGPDAGKTQHQVWLAKYRALLHRARKEPFVLHHIQQYGTLPIWAAIEVWDFGLLSKLFAGMQYVDQQKIAAMYGAPSGKAFAQWLRSLNFIRNVSAHHSRLWNINVLDYSPLPLGWPTQLNSARPFVYFCLMQKLLEVICPNSCWGQRFKDLLENEFPAMANQQISLAEFGAFSGWEKWVLWPQ
ncbi:Abi family protein [Thauera sp. Sel9]|uniref:Abi family protein n=1 Tax=Thauera sp. Sel9 TaxID=2974299 RepID=UPI0021E16D67|nr:Abi family protein [Thauera sp. Sel9]MCV2217666.1 Abi family protein [Thauera sp. Sel9]